MRMKILHVINGEHYAGGERVQDLLALRLPEFGYEAEFACLKTGVFDAKRVAQSVPLHDLAQGGGVVRKAVELVRANGFAALHTHTRRAALLGRHVSAKCGIPMVHHVHSPSSSDTESWLRNARNSLVEWYSLRRVDKLIPVSQSLEHYLLENRYPADRIVQVNNGVPLLEVTRRPPGAGGTFVFGTVALFRPRKGIEILLQAIARMIADGAAVKLYAVGPFETEDYRQTVMALGSGLGLEDAVDWVGFSDNVYREFQNMNAFVLPSLYGEGMPMVILEAMAAGLPIVGTRVEGVPEVVRHGRDGFLAAPGNVAALQQAMTDMAMDPEKTVAFGDQCRERQRACFSDVSMARAVAAVYDDLLNEREQS